MFFRCCHFRSVLFEPEQILNGSSLTRGVRKKYITVASQPFRFVILAAQKNDVVSCIGFCVHAEWKDLSGMNSNAGVSVLE